jgi:hypothetical protein
MRPSSRAASFAIDLHADTLMPMVHEGHHLDGPAAPGPVTALAVELDDATSLADGLRAGAHDERRPR